VGTWGKRRRARASWDQVYGSARRQPSLLNSTIHHPPFSSPILMAGDVQHWAGRAGWQQRARFLRLSHDVLLEIASLLDLASLLALRQVSRVLHFGGQMLSDLGLPHAECNFSREYCVRQAAQAVWSTHCALRVPTGLGSVARGAGYPCPQAAQELGPRSPSCYSSHHPRRHYRPSHPTSPPTSAATRSA
jgi:hypothetical protein